MPLPQPAAVVMTASTSSGMSRKLRRARDWAAASSPMCSRMEPQQPCPRGICTSTPFSARTCAAARLICGASASWDAAREQCDFAANFAMRRQDFGQLDGRWQAFRQHRQHGREGIRQQRPQAFADLAAPHRQPKAPGIWQSLADEPPRQAVGQGSLTRFPLAMRDSSRADRHIPRPRDKPARMPCSRGSGR